MAKKLLSKINPAKKCFKRQFSVSRNRQVKLVQFVYNHEPQKIRTGFLTKDENNVIDFDKIDPCFPSTLLEILTGSHFKRAMKYAADHVANSSTTHTTGDDITLKAPIHGMDKVLCVGLNYHDHCKAHKLKRPKVPMVFSKFSSTIIGPNDKLLIRNNVTESVDYEVELCVVMKSVTSKIKHFEAYHHVLGCTVAQDISARDWQREKNGGQFLLGKSMDTFCPIGPCIVTMDEIGDPEQLDIRCKINRELRQDSNTSQLIFRIPEIISRLSSVMTLLPGDIILTGTPSGVGAYADPPTFLKEGDVIQSYIEKIGYLENTVVNFDVSQDQE